ncbi:PAS-domain containing protein [Ramlibacter sp.]|uniref:PAS-domain containing protein n=1 Tax=Ramlibacter sp. TaxID=1917967 RepID=UPI003D149A1F
MKTEFLKGLAQRDGGSLEAALRLTLDNAGRGIVRYDAQGHVLLFNRLALEMLDLPEAVLAGSTVADIIRYQQKRGDFETSEIQPPGDPDGWAAELFRPHRYLRRTKSGRSLEIATTPLSDGGAVRTYTDVTAYVEAERALTEKTRALEITLDSMSQGISAIDGKGRLVFWNKQYQQLLDLPDSLLKSGPTMEQLVRFQIERGDFGDNFEFVDAVARGYVAVGDKAPPLEGPETYVRKTRDGRHYDVTTRPLPDGGVVRTFTDITAYVQSQEALLRAKEEAQEASGAKTRFLSSMSHEIRTPMNAVLGMLTLLRGTPLSARQADYATQAEGAARALLSLLNDILDFSKIEAGKMTLDARPFSLEQLLEDLSLVLSSNVGTRDIEVLYDLDPRVPDMLNGDDMRLRQILINLGSNAVKFTERGEVVLRTRLVRLQDGVATVEFAVQDSGIGISPEEQRHLFADYEQASPATARQYGGTGLGLGICRRLTELMGANLQLASTRGIGSRFWFTLSLPLVGDAAPAGAEAAGDAPQRVLIVDDNALARDSLAALARAAGWQADTAHDGAQALARIEGAAGLGMGYDVVFVDWLMPGLDGWQTCARIRALALPARPPLVVMVTAHGREMIHTRPAREQAMLDGFLVKPVTAGMLRTALRRAKAGPSDAMATTEFPLESHLLDGIRLLVAEDNEVNQRIAKELLTRQGAIVDVVGNGQLAVERLAEGHAYDAVLMDMQMPVMDGIAATHEIRKRFPADVLPIIAITANAMETDREACLAAGMNDHVGKPFVLEDVVAVILEHGVHDRPAFAETGHGSAAATDPVFDRVAAIARLGGDEDLLETVLPVFRENLERARTQLEPANAMPPDQLARVMHTIKGMAGNLGAMELSKLASEAEKALLAGREDHGASARVGAAIADVLRALSK